MLDMPPKERTIIPPKAGWKEHTYYLVEVAFRPSNPVHQAILGVGFLEIDAPEGLPGNYSEVWNNSYEQAELVRNLHYLKVVKELCTFD